MPAPVFPGLFYFQSVKELFNIQGFTPFRLHSKGTISLRTTQVFCVKIDLENHIYSSVFQLLKYINIVRKQIENSRFLAPCTAFWAGFSFFRQKTPEKAIYRALQRLGRVFFAGVLLSVIKPPGRQAAQSSEKTRKNAPPPCLPFPALEGGAALLGYNVKKAVFKPLDEFFSLDKYFITSENIVRQRGAQ